MDYFNVKILLLISIVFFLNACSAIRQITQPASDISTINLIAQYTLPYNTQFRKTIAGGFSGIDYNVVRDLYYLICDDRSDKNPARYYTAKIFFTDRRIDSVAFKSVNYMLQPNNGVYPNAKQNQFLIPDPEAIRFNPVKKQLVWTSEGERILTEKDTVLVNPSIINMRLTGEYVSQVPLPVNLLMKATKEGPRRNGVLEAMSFADNYKTLFVGIEEPLYEDGPQADMVDNNAYIRLYKFDALNGENKAQFAYKLEPIAFPAIPESAFKVNGVSEILSINANKLLVIERSFSTGRLPCTIKLFIADITNATDISNMALKNQRSFVPAAKKLLLNMDELGIYTDNIEGVTFGPSLPNGHRTLLFVSDNNFNPLQQTQLLLFEIIE
jgi:hypothetical protein